MSVLADRKVSYDKLYIDGAWTTPSSSDRIQVYSASTEESVGSVPEAREADVDRAVDAARKAFDDPNGWASWEPARRADAMDRLAAALSSRGEQTARLVSTQNGMPISLSMSVEAVSPGVLLRYYAGLARKMLVDDVRPGLRGGSTIVRRAPAGVVGAIVPWNYPQTLAFFKLAPALAAGCTIVVKPSPETVLDSFVLAEATAEAGIPNGVVNIVPGGREIGAYLVSHPKVDKISFTGSTAAGRSIAEACAKLLRPVTLELGGKSAAIILDDADLSTSFENFFAACMLNQGQTCYIGSRILAPKSRYAEIVDQITTFVGALKVGDALDSSTQIGPLASSGQRDRVEGYIKIGKSEGGRVTTGGGRPANMAHGWFVEPTVFADVDNNSTIAQQEIFGPVLTITPYETEDDAVRLANTSQFGLGGSVWTSNQERGIGVAKRVQTGSIGVNYYSPDPTAPFGGVKNSGIGRELGPEALAAYTNYQSVYLPPPKA
jgi:acyl-CoA reductase-like NAD-dependent aldehyde dehydrogenase